MPDPFAVKACALIPIATGERAQNLRELRDFLSTTDLGCIYYHFWGRMLRVRSEYPEWQNDFAEWVWRDLHDEHLAERLAIVDPANFTTIEDLRKEIIEIIDERLDELEYPVWTTIFHQFYFIRSQIVVVDTGLRLDNIDLIADHIPEMPQSSIFYHFIDARRRTTSGKDDFSEWLVLVGEQTQPLVEQIARIDPYFNSLDEIRVHLTERFDGFFGTGGEAAVMMLERYAEIVGQEAIDQLQRFAEPLKGKRIVHVNSTKLGGGVAEILNCLVPLKRELGLDATWEVITGDDSFFACTKMMHNALQGNRIHIPDKLLNAYETINERNFEALRPILEEADIVFIHDPQPAPLLNLCTNRKGKWIWRCHIDVSRPYRAAWKYLSTFVMGYDASVWSLAAFAQRLSNPMFVIPPSIDPLSEKNIELPREEIEAVAHQYNLDLTRPIITQVSRFDRFKDPVGVIQAFRLARAFSPLQLVLAGSGATDDPEGAQVLQETRDAAADNPDIHVLLLPPDAHRTINALQRLSDIVLQKSLREGFGLTVTEAMWKSKAVIGGDTGGIRLQVINHQTGFLVNTPEGAALRIRYLLARPRKLRSIGENAHKFALEHFLITRNVRDYLTLMMAVIHGDKYRIEV